MSLIVAVVLWSSKLGRCAVLIGRVEEVYDSAVMFCDVEPCVCDVTIV